MMKLSYKYYTIGIPLPTLRRLKRRMKWVRAAGGVVSDDEGNMLVILRNGRWDLPKGRVEEGESTLRAALREVQEETGVSASPQQFLTKTYHCYNLYGGWHLKQTFWYTMRVHGVCPPTVPQTEEGIEQAVWVRPRQWYRRMKHSYGTMRVIAKQMRWTRLTK